MAPEQIPRTAGSRADPATGFRADWQTAASHVATLVDRHSAVRAPRCSTSVELVLPDAGIELYLNLGPWGRHLARGRRTRPAPRAAWVVGPHARGLAVAKETLDCDIVSVRLHPATASRVFGVAASALRDQLVDLDALWPQGDVERLRDRLAHEPIPARRFGLVEAAILARLANAPASDEWRTARALCTAFGAGRTVSAGRFAAALGITHRKLIEACLRHIGLTPRACRRIIRLRRVLESVGPGPTPQWSRLAPASGYYDQAHLINEFRALTGMTPSAWLARRSATGIGFVPLVRSSGNRLARTSNPAGHAGM